MAALETTRIAVPGGELTAFVAGPEGGDVVLLLHGFPQSRHAWTSQVDALGKAGYRAVAVDQRGYSPGLRPDPADLSNYTIERIVGDAVAAADSAGARGKKFALVGIDWGGAIAWHVASRHPERLSSLTILSRPHPLSFAQAFRADADGQKTRSGHHAAFNDPATASNLLKDDASRLRSLFGANNVPQQRMEEYLSVVGNPHALEAALSWYRAAGKALTGGEAGQIKEVPTLYIWGEKDATVGPTAAKGTGEHVKADYKFVPLAGVGHFVSDEAPERVNQELLEHLRKHPPSGGSGRL